MANVIAKGLREQSYAVDVAQEGDAGLYQAAINDYDLIILDVRMPGLLGTEIAEALKQSAPSARIILISAFADASLRETASTLGTPLLSKPFSPADLFQAIDQTCAEGA